MVEWKEVGVFGFRVSVDDGADVLVVAVVIVFFIVGYFARGKAAVVDSKE